MRVDEIVKRECAKFYQLSRGELESQAREFRVAHPRQLAMTLTRRYGRSSLSQIGNSYGGRDHTTVLYALRIVARRVAERPGFAADIAAICVQIEMTINARRVRLLQRMAPVAPAMPPIALLPPPPKAPQLHKFKAARDARWTTFPRRVLVPA